MQGAWRNGGRRRRPSRAGRPRVVAGVGGARGGNGRLKQVAMCGRVESCAGIGRLRAYGKPLPFVATYHRRLYFSSARRPDLINARPVASKIITRWLEVPWLKHPGLGTLA